MSTFWQCTIANLDPFEEKKKTTKEKEAWKKKKKYYVKFSILKYISFKYHFFYSFFLLLLFSKLFKTFITHHSNQISSLLIYHLITLYSFPIAHNISKITYSCLEKVYYVLITPIRHLFWYFLLNKWVSLLSKIISDYSNKWLIYFPDKDCN